MLQRFLQGGDFAEPGPVLGFVQARGGVAGHLFDPGQLGGVDAQEPAPGAGVRCPMLWPDPTQRDRLVEIRDNLIDRIAEAEREGWLGEVEGLRVSLAGAEDKLAQLDRRRGSHAIIDPGIPTTSRGAKDSTAEGDWST
jgi:hypothetical protein